MVRLRLLASVLILASPLSLPAVDISPSRDNAPNSRDTPTGAGRFSIFDGDPARIQKANSIDFNDFKPTLDVDPSGLALSSYTSDASGAHLLKVVFNVKNMGKRTYTLSFPTSQRFELLFKNPAGQVVYKWSLDKRFLDEVGMLMINPTDQVGYTETIPLDKLYAPLIAGTYTVDLRLSNYPEIGASAPFKVSP
ncbi:Intracellular proteinase inhibitor [Verrucomicrobium sp. GAS474]|uniref:BsuPI-related putative proteinase inhibitor n=1 Tax=Verrucomicrobium sp. GAS474 TaxID=1882831 RepID=UPI00087A4C55|nr:BsuPI-related putative proteinase inhibitor [Verrucomicrobium sp. GAS474]SDU08218.1 Intracellular proteinase inhibitor [Verrucomicrobium sp. GAS474]